MTVTLSRSADGDIDILVAAPDLVEPNFRIRDMFKPRFLGPRGWSRVAVHIDSQLDDTGYHIRIQPDVAASIEPGTKLSLEEGTQDFRVTFVWPAPEKPEPTPLPMQEDRPQPSPVRFDTAKPASTDTKDRSEEAPTSKPYEGLPWPPAPQTPAPSKRSLLTGLLMGLALGVAATATIIPLMSSQPATRTAEKAPDLPQVQNLEAVIQRQKSVIEKLQGDLSAAILYRDLDTAKAETKSRQDVSALEARVKALSANLADSNRMLSDYREQVDNLNAELSKARAGKTR